MEIIIYVKSQRSLGLLLNFDDLVRIYYLKIASTSQQPSSHYCYKGPDHLKFISTNNRQFSNITSFYLKITSCRWLKENNRLLFSVTGIHTFRAKNATCWWQCCCWLVALLYFLQLFQKKDSLTPTDWPRSVFISLKYILLDLF